LYTIGLFFDLLPSLRNYTAIQKRIAIIFLVLYTICIAPKAFFHDVLAHHKDAPVCTHPFGASVCLHQQGFNCHFDNLVVTALYLYDGKAVVLTGPEHIAQQVSLYLPSSYSCYAAQSESRGPPAVESL
jgi:hypothetical protein